MTPPTDEPRPCSLCGEPIPPQLDWRAKYCSLLCRDRAARKRRRARFAGTATRSATAHLASMPLEVGPTTPEQDETIERLVAQQRIVKVDFWTIVKGWTNVNIMEIYAERPDNSSPEQDEALMRRKAIANAKAHPEYKNILPNLAKMHGIDLSEYE